MRALYRYVGPKKIAERAPAAPAGTRVESPEDVRHWIRQTDQDVGASGNVVATFVIDDAGGLRIADRRSEHVSCAGGRPVRSAGEMTFHVWRGGVRVSWVTNQSTGYCPEPDSWPAVEAALARAGLPSPDGFSQALDFRRCPRCASINIVKDGFFECGACSTPLPEEWNLDAPVAAEPSASDGRSGGAGDREPVGPIGEAAMIGRMTLREVREALAAARARETTAPATTPTVEELESLARILEREAKAAAPAAEPRLERVPEQGAAADGGSQSGSERSAPPRRSRRRRA
jgi:hypothetical protein